MIVASRNDSIEVDGVGAVPENAVLEIVSVWMWRSACGSREREVVWQLGNVNLGSSGIACSDELKCHSATITYVQPIPAVRVPAYLW